MGIKSTGGGGDGGSMAQSTNEPKLQRWRSARFASFDGDDDDAAAARRLPSRGQPAILTLERGKRIPVAETSLDVLWEIHGESRGKAIFKKFFEDNFIFFFLLNLKKLST